MIRPSILTEVKLYDKSDKALDRQSTPVFDFKSENIVVTACFHVSFSV